MRLGRPFLRAFRSNQRVSIKYQAGRGQDVFPLWRACDTEFGFECSSSLRAEECEEVFLGGRALPVGIQVAPPVSEKRYAVVGETTLRKPLFVVFTVRGGKVRVISARPMTAQESEDYDVLR